MWVETRITVLNKILMTQKKRNVLFYLQLVPVPQAKFWISEKTNIGKILKTIENSPGHQPMRVRSPTNCSSIFISLLVRAREASPGTSSPKMHPGQTGRSTKIGHWPPRGRFLWVFHRFWAARKNMVFWHRTKTGKKANTSDPCPRRGAILHHFG